MTLYVDTSRIGMHGIGRYSREVTARLDLPWTDLGQRFRKPLPLDVMNPRRLTLRADDVVYAPGFNTGPSRARQFLTVHDLIHLQVRSEGSRLKRQYYDRVVRPAVIRAGMVFTVSETSKRLIEDWLHAPNVSVVNTGNGVSAAFQSDLAPQAVVEDFFLYVGNFREHKNVPVILEALSRSAESSLVIVTSDVAEARRAVDERGLIGRVDIRTGIDDVDLARLYRRALAVLMPSVIEGFGLPAAEAVACGRPVVFWTGCESVAEIVGDRGVGVSSAADPRAWAAALESLRDRPMSFDDDGPSFDWDRVARRVTSALEDFVGRTG